MIPVMKGKLELESVRPPPGDWIPLILRPTATPLTNLTSIFFDLRSKEGNRFDQQLRTDKGALRQLIENRFTADQSLLLIVDQFEELFTLCKDGEDRESFINHLLQASGELCKVIITIRADFYANCIEFDSLKHILEKEQIVVGTMKNREIKDAIVEPAKVCGIQIQTGLVDRIVDDVKGQAGSLPLLSHALYEMWQQSENQKLTFAAYEAVGQVEGAIARTAENTYKEFDRSEQKIAKNLFVRLTEFEANDDVDEINPQDMRYTRRILSYDEWGDDTTHLEVLQGLVKARLITQDQHGIQVAHEAIISAWPQLAFWLAQDLRGNIEKRRLTNTVAAWRKNNFNPDILYRGTVLENALRELKSQELNGHEQYFLDECIKAHDAEERREKETELQKEQLEQRQQELKKRKEDIRRRNRWLIGSGFLILALIVTSSIALRQTSAANSARTEEKIAREQAEEEKLNAEEAREAAIKSQATAEAATDRAVVEKQNADDARLEAITAREQAELSELGARTLRLAVEAQNALDKNYDLALLLAIEAAQNVDELQKNENLDPEILLTINNTLRNSLRYQGKPNKS